VTKSRRHQHRPAIRKSTPARSEPLRNGKELDAEPTFLPIMLLFGGLWGARAMRGAGGFGSRQGTGSYPRFGGGFPGGRFNSGAGSTPNGGAFSGMNPFGWGGSPSGRQSGYDGFSGFPFSGNMFGMGGSGPNAFSQGGGAAGNGRWPFFF